MLHLSDCVLLAAFAALIILKAADLVTAVKLPFLLCPSVEQVMN